MTYPWSDIPIVLLHLLGNTRPEEAADRALAYADSKGLDLRVPGLGPDDPQPALLTMQGVCRWLQSSRQIIEISELSAVLFLEHAPRFSSLPICSLEPWSRGVLFRLGKERGKDIMVYAEPKEGAQRGIRYLVWVKDQNSWGTALPKRRAEESQHALDTWTDLDRILDLKPSLALMQDGTRLHIGYLRHVCVNALAAIHEQPNLIRGERNAPTPRGKVGNVHRVRRLTLDHDGARTVAMRWTTIDAGKHHILHRPHATPCMHVVQPHRWRVWTNQLRPNEEHLQVREKRRSDGSPFLQFLVSRLRGKDGPFTRGSLNIKPKESKLVTGLHDI